MKQLLWFLVAGTRGGETRARIINSVLEKPDNANRLAKRLSLDYKTIQHHLEILEKNNVFTVYSKGSYGAVYFPSKELKANEAEFRKIWNEFGKK